MYPIPKHNLLIGLKKIIEQQENLQIGGALPNRNPSKSFIWKDPKGSYRIKSSQ